MLIHWENGAQLPSDIKYGYEYNINLKGGGGGGDPSHPLHQPCVTHELLQHILYTGESVKRFMVSEKYSEVLEEFCAE